ncbi:MAG TPA: hypothetical protein VEJ63_06120, partial [Planctomycetota bacterium]|nr:hypothetical protein [Planctomycetota bacterium]
IVAFNPIPFNEIQAFLVSVLGTNDKDEDGDILTYVWNFGDTSTPEVTTTGTTGHTYILAGVPQELFTSAGTAEITATVTISDDGRGANKGSVTKSVKFFVVNPFGLGNVTDDIPAGNPANGINITSSGANGALKFIVTGAGPNPTITISPQTGVSPAGPITGSTFFVLFRQPGIYIVTVDDGNGNMARKMIPITLNEAAGGQRFNDSFAVDVTFITGRFSLDSDKPDSVAFRGRFPLQSQRYPEGAHRIMVGIGNIVATADVDVRGRGTPVSTVDFRNNTLQDAQQRFRFKYDRKKERAALDLMLRFPNLDEAGFDSEGVLAAFAPQGNTNQLKELNIPVVVLIDGQVSLASRIPAGFTVRNGTAQVVGSKK